MSFFGEYSNTTGAMEMGGGDIEPIPAKTQVKAAIEEAAWHHPQGGGDSVISLKWAVLAPKEYNNRKVFQKLKVNDSDPKKKAKALQMLAAIDKNCGGKLIASGQAPTDDSLMMALLNKPMVLLLQVWKMQDPQTGEDKQGNWVGAVSPMARAPKHESNPPVATDNFDDDIPF